MAPFALNPRSDCAIWLVPSELTAAAWLDAAPLLRAAVARSGGRYSIEDFPRRLGSGEMQLFLALGPERPVAAAITEILRYPASRRLAVLFCGGKGLKEWGEAGIAAIEDWARLCDCDGVEIHGRVGWARAIGYRKTATILERSLR